MVYINLSNIKKFVEDNKKRINSYTKNELEIDNLKKQARSAFNKTLDEADNIQKNFVSHLKKEYQILKKDYLVTKNNEHNEIPKDKNTKNDIPKDEIIENTVNIQINNKEKNYYSTVYKFVDEYLNMAINYEAFISSGYNTNADNYDPSIYKKQQKAIEMVDLWRGVRKTPYFARVDYGNGLKFYIGNNTIDSYVIDKRDELSDLYYQYNIYIDNPEYNITLVREFDIRYGKYYGYNDKYSKIT